MGDHTRDTKILHVLEYERLNLIIDRAVKAPSSKNWFFFCELGSVISSFYENCNTSNH